VLLRESRRSEDPLRVVRIEKTETIHGFFGLGIIPPVLSLANGRPAPGDPGQTGPEAGVVMIRAVFDRSDPALVDQNKGETMMRYEHLREGQTFTPAKQDFFLFSEPYATQFFPVFGFEANGLPVARLSHIGRHGGPTLALQLFGPGVVYFDPKQPSDAILTADPGPVGGDPLGWFSRLCEGIFSQWGSTALIAIAGLAAVLTGLLLISLHLIPPKP
jgi:hypothetical protein